jgi:hypothetical protein
MGVACQSAREPAQRAHLCLQESSNVKTVPPSRRGVPPKRRVCAEMLTPL